MIPSSNLPQMIPVRYKIQTITAHYFVSPWNRFYPTPVVVWDQIITLVRYRKVAAGV